MWIPSHIGIPGNELADDLASKAVTLPNIQVYQHIPYEDIIQFLKNKLHSLWKFQWEKQTSNFSK
jgi:hypothetical protein